VRGVTERVSVGRGGAQANGFSGGDFAISVHGRWVAFASQASNLVVGDNNSTTDAFVRDRRVGVTERVSVGPGGGGEASNVAQVAMSPHGRFVAFNSNAYHMVAGNNHIGQVFVRDRLAGVTVSPRGPRQDCPINYDPAVSHGAPYVGFVSCSTNLVAGDTNGVDDVFVWDRSNGVIQRVSVGPGGAQGNHESGELSATTISISANGRYIAFPSAASNLVRFPDTNRAYDVFVRDLVTGVTRRVSVADGGKLGNQESFNPALSTDGRYVAFASAATNLVPGDTNGFPDVFVRTRW
jgi:hypothetical protein